MLISIQSTANKGKGKDVPLTEAELTANARTLIRQTITDITIGVAMVNILPEHNDPQEDGPHIVKGQTNQRDIDPKKYEQWKESIIHADGELQRNNRNHAIYLLVKPSALSNESEIRVSLEDEPIVVAQWNKSARRDSAYRTNGTHRTALVAEINERLLRLG